MVAKIYEWRAQPSDDITKVVVTTNILSVEIRTTLVTSLKYSSKRF